MKSRLALISTLALLSSLLTLSASAASTQVSAPDQRFEALLRAIDIVPDRPQMERAWPDIRARLLAAASDDRRDLYSRSRAMSLLSFFPEPAVREALVTLAAHQDVEIRRLAVYTAARTFGSPGDPALVALVEAAAADRSPRVREHAVRALRWIDHPAAARALERVAGRSDEPSLTKLARRVQARRARRLGAPRR